MSGITDLQTLLATLRPVAAEGEWVFVTGLSAVEGAVATVVEQEGVTSVVDRAVADAARLPYGPILTRITLQVYSALEAVGLTAAVATALAANGIPANVIAGYFHDHVYVPHDRATEALDVLHALSAQG